MIILLLMLLTIFFIIQKIIISVYGILYRIKIYNILESLNSKEDLLYLHFKDFLHVVMEVLRRKGYKIKPTDRCGEEGNGLLLNELQYVEVWKHGLTQLVDVEAPMKLVKCMQSSSIYRGMLITLGDFKQSTKMYCHKNVIECINGDQLLAMCKEVQRRKAVLEVG